MDLIKSVAAFQVIYRDGDQWKIKYVCCEALDEKDMWYWPEEKLLSVVSTASNVNHEKIAYYMAFFHYIGGGKKDEIRKFFELIIERLSAGRCSENLVFYDVNDQLLDQYYEETEELVNGNPRTDRR